MFKKIVSKLKNKTVAAITLAMSAMAVGASSAFASSTSNATDFSTTGGLGITNTDIVSTGFSFAKLFNSQTTMILGIILVPTIVGFIIWLFRKMPKMGGSKS